MWKKNEKGPLSHWKIKCSFLDYIQLLMISQAIRAKNVDQNTKKWKRPPKSSKNKWFIFGLCSTSDIGQVIWAKMLTKMQKNEKGPLSLKNKMFIFGLCLHSDDRLSDPGKNVDWNAKNKKGPLSHWKIKCLFFWLCSTSDDWLSNPGKKCWPKHKKMKKAPCHWKIKCSFLDYVYILMIGWVIWAKNVDRKAKK